MALAGNDLATSIITEQGGTADNTTLITKMEARVNDLYKEIFNQADWPFAVTFDSNIVTVGGQDEYSLTTSAETILMRLTDLNREIHYVPYETPYLNL